MKMNENGRVPLKILTKIYEKMALKNEKPHYKSINNVFFYENGYENAYYMHILWHNIQS